MIELIVEALLSLFVAPISHVQGTVPVNAICYAGTEADWNEIGDRIVVDYDYPGWYQLYQLPNGNFQLLVMYQNPHETSTPHVVCFREFHT